jgi:hypothetical protein
MEMVKAPLQTVYNGKIENLRLHIQGFTRRIKNTGFYHEISIRTTETPRPADIPDDAWTFDHPLRWQTANYIKTSTVSLFPLFSKRKNALKTLWKCSTTSQ